MLPPLVRYPTRPGETLQAWDAADELMLAHFAETEPKPAKVLVLNDSFGALTRGLGPTHVYTDSYCVAQAIHLNTQTSAVCTLEELTGPYDAAYVRIPKNLAFFEEELVRLSQCLEPGAPVVCGAMVKHLAKGAFDLLARYTGATHTSLAKKKARLVFAKQEKLPGVSPYPTRVMLDGFTHPFVHPAHLFSREKLDLGTRFLLEHLPVGPYRHVADLGCANGVVGIAAQHHYPQAQLLFTDDSRMAVQSAQANYATYFPNRTAQFLWTNALEGVAAESLDLVLCNPPFHQGTTVGDHIAHAMFQSARQALAKHGRVRVVGNSHLFYPALLKRYFGEVQMVAKNEKFTIVDALRA